MSCRTYFNQIRTSYNVFQTGESHLCQVFTYLLCQETEEVDHITIMSAEMCPQLRILCSHTYRTRIGMTFTHHDTSQNNQYRSSESKLFCSQQSHADDVTSSLQLSVSLQTYLTTESVEYQCLLCLAQTDFRRNTGIAHGRGRRSSCSTFCS